jgi:hypothetical protein
MPLSARSGNATAGQRNWDEGDLDEMIRREFLRLASIASALISAPQTKSPTGNTQGFFNIGDVDDCERMNSHLWQIFSLSTSKRAVYPAVREQLSTLTDGLKKAVNQETHSRLCAAAGDLFRLAGEIFFDSSQYTNAAHCYALAASASKEARQYDLWACALTRHSFIVMNERQFSDAVPLLEAAEHVAQFGDGQLSTRYWVAAVQAEAFAGVGDFDACRRSLDIAEQVQSLTGVVHNGGWLRFDGLAARD